MQNLSQPQSCDGCTEQQCIPDDSRPDVSKQLQSQGTWPQRLSKEEVLTGVPSTQDIPASNSNMHTGSLKQLHTAVTAHG